MERFIERFRYKATKARQAQSRVKKLAKMERIERDPREAKGLEFAFSAPQRSGRVIFELLDGRIEVGGEAEGKDGRVDPPLVLLEHAELWLERGEHVSLVGPNGTGKTTLIETLAGRRELAAGRLSVGHNVKIGYLSQHAAEFGAGGPAEQSVLDAAQRATGLTPGKARALLGRFLFSGEEAEKPLSGLSGGERRRLSLAVLVGPDSHPPNVLILDEPTNHLDIESREALEDALRAFKGAILLVSHDRALLDAVGTRTIAVEEGALHSYVGGWPEYVRVREERSSIDSKTGAAHARPHGGAHAGRSSIGLRQPAHAPAGTAEDSRHAPAGTAEESARANGAAAEKPKRKPKPKGPSKNRLSAQQQAEREVEQAEGAMRALEAELTDPAAWASRYESAKSEARHTAATRAVEDAYARLEALID